ncbi:MAG: efflux transporter outer membrane subunit [Dongiaceae bacterium]
MRRTRVLPAAAALLLAASGCTVGPDYQRPAVEVPAAYKEQPPAADGWRTAVPQDAAARGSWWSVFGDPQLDALIRQVDVSNENLKAFEAAFRAAQAGVAASRAGLFPTLSLGGSFQRAQSGGISGQPEPPPVNSFDFSLASASWQPDLWGRIRRTIEASRATAGASAGDLASARLAAEAELAADYLQLRIADALKRLLDETVVAFRESLRIATNQYNAGIVSKADVVSAETQVRSTEAQAINVGVQRAQFEHAIALLIGKAPADLSIPAVDSVPGVPVAPAGLPSALLERRPDIAAAERRVAAANAEIGVAIAAYFPDITLTASYGTTAANLANLAQFSNPVWAVGLQLAQTVFDAGLRGAQVEQARATFDQSAALYRQTVLTAFQQVEDQLAALRILEQQAAVEADTVRLALEAQRLTLNQYKAGTVPYTSVITAQTQALANQQIALSVLQSRLLAAVALIQALGGGWDTGEMPGA